MNMCTGCEKRAKKSDKLVSNIGSCLGRRGTVARIQFTVRNTLRESRTQRSAGQRALRNSKTSAMFSWTLVLASGLGSTQAHRLREFGLWRQCVDYVQYTTRKTHRRLLYCVDEAFRGPA